jgi:hypothetical protein
VTKVSLFSPFDSTASCWTLNGTVQDLIETELLRNILNLSLKWQTPDRSPDETLLTLRTAKLRLGAAVKPSTPAARAVAAIASMENFMVLVGLIEWLN